MNPRFIILDSIDGMGKPIDLAVMKQWFEARRLSVLLTRELGGTLTSEALCEILLNPGTKIGLHTEALLMLVVRQQYLEDVILPALKNGIHAMSDRFADATFAYQGGGRGVPLQDTETLKSQVQDSFWPGLTLLLDMPLEVSLECIGRVRGKDRFEREQADFFARVRDTYSSRATMNLERYAVTDGNCSLEAVRTNIETALEVHFGSTGQTV